ncbi:MAG: MarR family winged helix-turn-helix transcriptional regulator [Lachnotalea sp.]
MNNFENTDHQLNECLFFSSCKLARILGKTADDEFKMTGLSPSHAFLLYIVNNNNGIQQKQIGELLHMTPSTITRFIEKLENKELVTRKAEGKNVFIFYTEKGKSLQGEIEKAWEQIHRLYTDILTEEEHAQFIATTNKIIASLEHK